MRGHALLLICLLAGGALLSGLAARPRAACAAAAGRAQPVAALPVLPALSPGDRLLVLAPHCDDETLACGGLLASAVRAGAAAKVVVVSNGESYHNAAVHLCGSPLPGPREHITLGQRRQRESQSALRVLGLAPDQVVFLGYPDRGLTAMWLTHWEPNRPYTSPYTRTDRSPYREVRRPGASYCGRSLVEDLAALLREFRPTLVVLPHPGDRNQDHAVLYGYGTAALHEAGLLGAVRLLVYPVHVPGWPSPRGLRPEQPLLPPASLSEAGTRWVRLPLDQDSVRCKQGAIMCYRSQLTVERDYLLSFARTNELFGLLPKRQLLRAPGERPAEERPASGRRFALVARDPAGDSRDPTLPGADLLAVSAAREERRLWLRLDGRGPASAEVEYRVELHWLAPRQVGPPLSYVFRNGRAPRGCEVRSIGNEVTLALPWPREPAAGGVILSVSTVQQGRVVDATAWALVE
jgi:LmbE family N-acetylglucosaminyl deacetylase